jgi:alcohol dehydrogenase class IV
MSLREVGIEREAVERRMDKLIENAENEATTVVHPRIASAEELERLFTYAYEGREIDF